MKRRGAGSVVVAMLVTVTMLVSGCSFVGTKPHVDLALGGAAVVGSVVEFDNARSARDDCHDDCFAPGLGHQLLGTTLALAAVAYGFGALYGFARDHEAAKHPAPAFAPIPQQPVEPPPQYAW